MPSGATTPAFPLAASRMRPQVTIGGQPSEVLFSGLAPGKVGFYHIKLVVPSTVSEGEWDVVISQGKAAANAASLMVAR